MLLRPRRRTSGPHAETAPGDGLPPSSQFFFGRNGHRSAIGHQPSPARIRPDRSTRPSFKLFVRTRRGETLMADGCDPGLWFAALSIRGGSARRGTMPEKSNADGGMPPSVRSGIAGRSAVRYPAGSHAAAQEMSGVPRACRPADKPSPGSGGQDRRTMTVPRRRESGECSSVAAASPNARGPPPVHHARGPPRRGA